MRDRATIAVSGVTFAPAHHDDRMRGLLGWTSFVVGEALMLEGVAVRRTREGKIRLSFPEPTDIRGKRHRPVWPIDAEAMEAVEGQVLGALRHRGDLAP